MPAITEGKFWTDLLKKILHILLNSNSGGDRTGHQHVVPHEDGWAVKGAGNQKATAVYKYQKDAIDRAREIARRNKTSVIIHREDGTIRDRLNFGE